MARLQDRSCRSIRQSAGRHPSPMHQRQTPQCRNRTLHQTFLGIAWVTSLAIVHKSRCKGSCVDGRGVCWSVPHHQVTPGQSHYARRAPPTWTWECPRDCGATAKEVLHSAHLSVWPLSRPACPLKWIRQAASPSSTISSCRHTITHRSEGPRRRYDCVFIGWSPPPRLASS